MVLFFGNSVFFPLPPHPLKSYLKVFLPTLLVVPKIKLQCTVFTKKSTK